MTDLPDVVAALIISLRDRALCRVVVPMLVCRHRVRIERCAAKRALCASIESHLTT